MITLKSLGSGVRGWGKSAAALPHRREVERAWTYGRDEFWLYQEFAFRKLYRHATRHVPYYRNRATEYGELPDSRNALDFLRGLPLLTKATVKKNNTEFWAEDKRALRTEHRTSGTTGTPIRIVATLTERGLTQAVLESWYFRICGSRWPRTLALTGFMTPEKGSGDLSWYDPVRRQLFLSTYSLGMGNRDKLIRAVKSFNPSLIYGSPSNMSQLAAVLGDALCASAERRVAVCTAEVLYDHWRERIRNALAHRVYNLYGSQEGSHFVLECEHGNFHIMPLIGIVEIVDDLGQPTPAGAVGHVAVTGISKLGMPLIRYLLGDNSTSTSYADCSCGLGWPTIGSVEGRSEDVVITRDGRRIGLLATSVIKHAETGILESQLIQRAYDRFDCKLVIETGKLADRSAIEQGIKDELRIRMGYDVLVSFEYLSQIPRTSRDKFRAMLVNFDGGVQ